MSNSKNVYKMTKDEILSKICSGRNCEDCPLGKEPNCEAVLKKDLIVAYRKLFFNVSDRELMKLINGG